MTGTKLAVKNRQKSLFYGLSEGCFWEEELPESATDHKRSRIVRPYLQGNFEYLSACGGNLPKIHADRILTKTEV